jgi:hypothetical protein
VQWYKGVWSLRTRCRERGGWRAQTRWSVLDLVQLKQEEIVALSRVQAASQAVVEDLCAGASLGAEYEGSEAFVRKRCVGGVWEAEEGSLGCGGSSHDAGCVRSV